MMTAQTTRPATDRRKILTRGGASVVLASAGLMAFLGRWEGEEQFTVYADKLAGGLPTVCRGLTKHVTSTPIVVGERWTREKCEAEEMAAVEKVQRQVAACFKALPPQDVFDAASSHAWNLGAPATCGSKAMQAWNAGDYALGCRRISRGDDGKVVWSFTSSIGPDGKKVLTFVQGLANRRSAETQLCQGRS